MKCILQYFLWKYVSLVSIVKIVIFDPNGIRIAGIYQMKQHQTALPIYIHQVGSRGEGEHQCGDGHAVACSFLKRDGYDTGPDQRANMKHD